MSKSVIIIGAGMGGLATAMRLASKGYQVHILEKNSQPGGRLNQLKKDGFTFDTGPSFFSMSYEFTDFARDCGIELPFEFVELDPLYAVNFSGSPKTYLLHKDLKKLAAQFDDEPDFEKRMERYLEKCGFLFHDTFDVAVKQNFNSLWSYIKSLMKLSPSHLPVLTRKFSTQVNQYFKSKDARRIISLVAFFLGRTPFETPGIYTMLSYTEFRHDGYYNVKGGMYKIVTGLLKELQKKGVRITYDTEIVDIEANGKRLVSLIDKNGNKWTADSFVVNADAAVFRGSVLKRKAFSSRRLDRKEWTMGYLTLYLGLNCKLPGVHHHNYFLGDNFDEYAKKVNKNPGALEKPYYYVNVVSKYNEDCAPEGCESVFIVCPVPDLKYKPDWSDRDKIVDSIIEDLGKRIKMDIRPHIISRTVYTPEDWKQQFNLHNGSGLGLSHNLRQIGPLRPRNYDEEFNNLFYVGASTAPGTGLPMVVISSKLAFERVSEYTKNE